MPDLVKAAEVAGELRAAIDAHAEGADSAAKAMTARAALLREALHLHNDIGDGPCPVCETGTLDTAWRDAAEERLKETDASTAEHQAVTRRLARARAAAEGLFRGRGDGTCGRRRRSRVPVRLRRSTHTCAIRARQPVRPPDPRGGATAMLAEPPAPCAPKRRHASRVGGCLGSRGPRDRCLGGPGDRGPERRRPARPGANRAEVVAHQRRNAAGSAPGSGGRSGPRDLGPGCGTRATSISSGYLEGAANRRKAVVEGSVDGVPAGALSVMSQGELHALALALFIPRATTPDSPFRFLVLDDPIQAMDPAKIGGFLDVLVELAKTRQVIVFSHDDRLPAAIRARSIPAQLFDVTREEGSVVVVKPNDLPAHRYIDDATAVILDDDLDDMIKRRAAPGLFRMAVEAAAHQRFFTDRARAGAVYHESDAAWEEAKTTQQRVALAVTGAANGRFVGLEELPNA